ncbi:CheR family methyltransferase [Spirosoma sp. KUDC1026]|uniref:CheR family methyltransferase n=1 Tax=Spirosoma sp. KUDC1026 TaxID=2745947 RepID=UPI00159BE86F|nr:CheR family methyltransferase [Spirosoma sp. KUDC1026]QKZ11793.1 PAS domain S-box protein [Spirosoma sp. KUDC1026]
MLTNDTDAVSSQPSRKPVPVVAIGGATGSLDALSDLLRYMPSATGMAFVYVQHADLVPVSQLSSVLSQATTMPVVAAEHQQQIVPNQVYVLTSDKDMGVVDGVLTFIPRQLRRSTGSSSIRMPIDEFFLSLATRQREGSIAILLSGSGNDGTAGLKAIKAAGGITFAQDETASFQSMPKAAISEGVVDKVLSPADIADEVIRLSQQINVFRQTAHTEGEIADDQDPTANDEDLRKIILFLRRSIGVDFTHYKVTTIRRRVVRRMLLYKLETLADYAQYLSQHPAEGKALYSDLLINVTNFFRDTDTMDYLKKVLLPQLVKSKTPRESIRIWVPACSTGEEAYSIAMLLTEIMNEQGVNIPINIFATDLSESAIARARLGTYTRSQMLDVSPKRVQRFFSKVDDHYRISKAIRDLCVFAPHNVFKDPPFSRLDLVSCRNMLIYTENVLQRKAIATFHYALNPNGYLLLGKSETVGASTSLFVQVEKRYKIFVRKNDAISRATFDMNLQPGPIQANLERQLETTSLTEANAAKVNMKAKNPLGNNGNNLDNTVDNILLGQYTPASVVVNQDLEILQFRGSTGLFLEPAPGKASLNLLKMARPTLAFDLRSIIHKAQKAGQAVRKSGLKIRIKEQTHYVAIEAVPLSVDTEERLYLVLFEEITPSLLPETTSSQSRNQRIKQLEEELSSLREDMRSIIEEQEASNEELQSANEEIVSSNEELQSINEELETSKEEIESTNEELLTINQELQVRNDQLSEAYSYSEAIFSTIREATIVLDKDLRLKSANKAFYKTFRLREDETEGVLIYELDNRQWNIDRLRQLLEDVIHQNAVIQNFEVTHHFAELGEKVLRFNACKVVQQQRQEAILIAIEDITESRRAQRLSEEREAWFRNLTDSAPMLIWVADADGRYSFLNQAWLTYTGRTQEEEIERGWAQDIHPDDRDNYLAVYKQKFAIRESFSAEYRLLRHDGEYRWMLEYAEPTFFPNGDFSGYVGIDADIHLQKELQQELDRRVRQRTQELQTTNTLLNRTESIAHIGSYELILATNASLYSDEMYRLFGFEPGQVSLNADFMDSHTYPGDVAPIAIRIEQALKDHQPFEYIRRIYRNDGQMRYLFNRHEVMRDETGKVVKIVGFAQDITEQRLAQKRVRESEEQFRTLVENTRDVITRWDIDLKLVFANSAFAEKTGAPLSVLLGKTNQEMGQPDSVAIPYMDKLREVFDTGTSQDHYNIFTTPKGITLYYSVIVPELASNGRIQSVLAIARDITELKEAEKQIQETNQHLQAVLNSSTSLIAFFKAVHDEHRQIMDFRLAVCNERFAAMMHKTASQLLHQPVAYLEKQLWQEKTLDILRQVRLTNEPFYEERHTPDNPESQWVAISVTRFDDGVVVNGLDITVLKQAEQQQQQLFNEIRNSSDTVTNLHNLRQYIKERGEFLRRTSHDLRGNFGIIQGAASMLDLATDEEEREQMLSMLQRNIKQATDMLTELLDFARLEAGQEQRHLASFDVAQLLDELIASLQPMADERALWLRADGVRPLFVEGDAIKVNRIAQNLLLNALTYTQTGGVAVNWEAVESSERWQLTITDSGPGLAQKDISAINSRHGEGIGLAIVRQLCDLLDGDIAVTSKPKEGTRFVISFPSSYPVTN